MFDWNDEELTNIIWGEAAEGGDHIVPYPDASEEKPSGLHRDDIKKGWNREAADLKPAEQKTIVALPDCHENKIGSSSQYNTNEALSSEGVGMDSWPDLSLSNAAKSDQDSIGIEASRFPGEASRPDNVSEMFQSQHEEGEDGDFVDYGWANIGSFDDFDRIFSNEDPIFGNVSLGSADELWSSSKDAPISTEKSISLSIDPPALGLGALGSTSEHFEIKTECMLNQDHSFALSFKNANDPTSLASKNILEGGNRINCSVGKSHISDMDKTSLRKIAEKTAFDSHIGAEPVTTKSEFPHKMNRPRKILKSRKKSEESNETGQLQELSGTWSSYVDQPHQLDGQYSPLVAQACPSPRFNQPGQLQGPESSRYKHFPNPLVVPVYGNMMNQIPALPVLAQYHSGEGNHQAVPPFYEVPSANSNSVSNSPDASVKPLVMTPQEKIEKLRRRQQMRAMLAIQKQQQQFSQPTEQSPAQNCLHEKQILDIEGGNVEENSSSLPSLDPNSPLEQDDSNTISMSIDDYSMEDAIIQRLQDIIEKMDIQMRLCIRDSLFRLAQSAMQRQYASDTSSTNKSSQDEYEIAREETKIQNRFTSHLPDVETDTNPIDRTVAHLLFHRPHEFSAKLSEMPESPVSSKLPREKKSTGLVSTPMIFLPESSKNDGQNVSHQIPCLFSVMDQSKSSTPCMDASENASNHDAAAADGGVSKVEGP